MPSIRKQEKKFGNGTKGNRVDSIRQRPFGRGGKWKSIYRRPRKSIDSYRCFYRKNRMENQRIDGT